MGRCWVLTGTGGIQWHKVFVVRIYDWTCAWAFAGNTLHYQWTPGKSVRHCSPSLLLYSYGLLTVCVRLAHPQKLDGYIQSQYQTRPKNDCIQQQLPSLYSKTFIRNRCRGLHPSLWLSVSSQNLHTGLCEKRYDWIERETLHILHTSKYTSKTIVYPIHLDVSRVSPLGHTQASSSIRLVILWYSMIFPLIHFVPHWKCH